MKAVQWVSATETMLRQCKRTAKMTYPRIKLWEATIRTPQGKEFTDRVGAAPAEQARILLQQKHGPRAVPSLPRMIAG